MSVTFFSICLQSFPASSFSMSLLFASHGQKYCSFSFSISPSNEYSGLISFRIDWFGLLAVQGTLKSLLQNHSQKHQLFGAQPSLWSNSQHPYLTTGKTIALIRQTFVSKVMSLLFNMLSRFVTAFLPRSKSLLISWLQSLSGGASGKDPACHCRRHKKPWFDPWVKMIPWRRKWQPSPVFLPGEFHAQRSLAGYSP